MGRVVESIARTASKEVYLLYKSLFGDHPVPGGYGLTFPHRSNNNTLRPERLKAKGMWWIRLYPEIRAVAWAMRARRKGVTVSDVVSVVE